MNRSKSACFQTLLWAFISLLSLVSIQCSTWGKFWQSQDVKITSFNPTSGAAGDSVILQGELFDSSLTGNTVRIGGVTADVTVASQSQLTITVPGGVLSGLISVSNSKGTGQTSNSFTAYKYFLYIGNQGSNTVSAFSLNHYTGAVAAVAGSPFATDVAPIGLVVDPKGRFLYTANNTPGTISGFKISAQTGALSAVPNSPFAGGSGASRLGIDVTGNFIYMGYTGGSAILGYRIDNTAGSLTPLAGSPYPVAAISGGTPIAEASGKYLITGLNTSASVHSIDANGFLTQIPGSPFAVGTSPKGAAIDSSNRYVYSSNIGANNISGFSIDPATGTLTPTPNSPYATGATPYFMTISPDDKFVYVGNNGANSISVYTLNNSTGELVQVPGSPVTAGNGPRGVVVAPGNRFLYMANYTGNNLTAYDLNASTGLPVLLPGFPVATGTSANSVVIAKIPQ